MEDRAQRLDVGGQGGVRRGRSWPGLGTQCPESMTILFTYCRVTSHLKTQWLKTNLRFRSRPCDLGRVLVEVASPAAHAAQGPSEEW